MACPLNNQECGCILLVGLPRSGTTWTGKIFDSHPDVVYRHEPDSIMKLEGVPVFADPCEAKKYGDTISKYISSLYKINHVQVCSSLPFFKKSYRPIPLELISRLGILGSKVASNILGWQLPTVGASWGIRRSNVSLVWKSVHSLGRIGIFLEAQAGICSIHIIRHPCGYVASILRGREQSHLTNIIPASDDYVTLEMLLKTTVAKKQGITMSGLKKLTPEERLAWRWVLINEKAILETNGDFRNLTFRYEDLCEHPVKTAKKLFKHAGLQWHPQTERFVIKSTSHNDDRYYGVYKRPLDSAYKWKKYLNNGQKDRILSVVENTIPGALYK